MKRREFLAGAAAAVAAFPRLLGAAAARADLPLHAMHTWLFHEDLPSQVALLKRLGYAGLSLLWKAPDSEEELRELRKAGLEPSCLLARSRIDEPLEGPEEFLRGSKSWIWLALSGARASDADGEKAGLATVTALADRCKAAGLPGVALMPFPGTWVQSTADALRMAKRLDRPDVGVVFHLTTCFLQESEQDPARILESSRAFVKGLVIHGWDKERAVVPLNEGKFDPLPLVRVLQSLNFAGPVVHAGSGVPGRVPAQLEAIQKRWKELQQRARESQAEIVRAHLFISGIVQGVSYRASTQIEAQKRGVVGWVKNLEDGRVEAVLQGPRNKVDEIVRWCHQGPPAAKVDKVAVAWEKAADEFKGFDVRY